MKQKIIVHGGWMLALFALLTLLLCSCAVKKPEVVSLAVDGQVNRYRFDEAVDKAEYVVYGTVVKKGKQVEAQYTLHEKEYTDCYHIVTVKVIECAKGGLRAGDTVTYWEWGGETEDQIYQYEYTQEVEKGDTVFVFVNNGRYIGPDWLWILDSEEDETIRMKKIQLPESIAFKVTIENPREGAAVPLRSLLDAARALADGIDENPSDDAA